MLHSKILVLLLILSSLIAQWPTSPDSVIQVGWDGGVFNAISDNHGGVYIVRGAAYNIFCSRIDSSGHTPWEPQILDYEGDEIWFSGVSTSSDEGLFISYHDYDFEGLGGPAYVVIKVQKLDRLGNKLWGTGVIISPPDASGDPGQGELLQSKIIGTRDGGVYVIWGDLRDGGSMTNLFVQRLSTEGELLWNNDGIRVADSLDGIYYLQVNEDNDLSIVFATSDLSGQRTQYIQSYSESGIEQFEIGGFQMPTPIGTHYSLDILGNLFYRYYADHVVRINLEQLPTLDWFDVLIDSPGETYISELCPDDSGGVFISIYGEDGENNLAYFQLLDVEGSLRFGEAGIPGPPSGYWDRATLTNSNEGFIFILSGQQQVAYKINRLGLFDWEGVPLFNGPVEYHPWPTVISDGSGGAIYLFEDDYRVWASKISADGVLGGTSSIYNLNLIPDTFTFTTFPNPFNSEVIIDVKIEEYCFLELKLFDITGRLISSAALGFRSPGSHKINWKPNDGLKQNLSSGAYIVQVHVNGSSSHKRVTYLK